MEADTFFFIYANSDEPFNLIISQMLAEADTSNRNLNLAFVLSVSDFPTLCLSCNGVVGSRIGEGVEHPP